MSGRLAGKVALVTGAASGIGRATFEAFRREGAKVAATDLAAPDLEHPDGGALALALDVTDEAAWERALAATAERFGGFDVLVNNAGIGGASPTGATPLADWRRIMAVNLDGVFLGCRAAITAMAAHPRPFAGAIVNLSSIFGLVSSPHSAAYSASKGGVRLLTKSVALECARAERPIRVNSVHPGYIDTPLVADGIARRAGIAGAAAEDMLGGIRARHPLGRLGRPEDIAGGILFLASEEAAFVTGSELVIDGGYTAQ